MVMLLLILAVIFAGIETWRARSFGWAAVGLIAAALVWPQLAALH